MDHQPWAINHGLNQLWTVDRGLKKNYSLSIRADRLPLALTTALREVGVT
jgi:hypothetical protein